MSLSRDWILILGSIGAIQSFFLGFYILSLKGRHFSNLLLGLLFIALAIRVSKSLLWAFWDGTPLIILNLGFAAHAFSGPLLLLYLYHFLNPGSSFHKLNWLQFLPGLVILGGAETITLSGFWYRGGYSVLLYYQLIYMVASLMLALMHIRKNKKTGVDRYWGILLSGGVSIWGLAYFSNYILGWTSYLLGPALYSGIIYGLSFVGLRQQDLFKKQFRKKYKNINLSQPMINEYKQKLEELMQEEKLYLQPDFSLPELAKKLSIHTHVLSHIINDQLGVNFSEFVNNYRIRDAKNMLQDPGNNHLKIASIAQECGFNSLSSFNNAFRKEAMMTPSEFRDGLDNVNIT